MISYIWLWIIWLWIYSDTQPMRVIHWYSDIQTNEGYLLVLWYPVNGGYSLILWYPNQWGLFIGTLIPSQWGLFIGTLISSQWELFIGTLIPKPMWGIYWYSDIQTNGGYSLVLWYPANEGYSLVFWYPNQWGLFIDTLIFKSMGVIHWYSDAQSRGYSVTIFTRLLRIWITFEHWTILSHLNCLCIFGTYCKL